MFPLWINKEYIGERKFGMGVFEMSGSGVFEADQYIRKFYVMNPLRETVIRDVIKTVNLPPGGRGLDVGCGIGLNTVMLAEAVGPGGHVAGLDMNKESLAEARLVADRSGLGERVTLVEGDAERLPFGDNAFDFACSIDCVGYVPMDTVPLLRDLARVVRPGGLVFIIVWSSQKLLPGHPVLEAGLNATSAGIAPFAAGMPPDRHFMRAPGWFVRAGLGKPEVRTLAQDICAPLSDGIREGLAELFQMRWGESLGEVAPDVREEYRRLCSADSPDFILNKPDYYAFFTYTCFVAKS